MVSKTWRRESLQEKVSDPVLREDAEDSSSDSGGSIPDGSEHDTHSSGEEDGNDENQNSKSGWADAIAKILRTNKPRKKRSIVLSRAKKLNDVSKKLKLEAEDEFEIDVKEEKPDLKNSIEETKDIEKLQRTGVVQLYNVVRQHQKKIDVQLKEAGGSFRKEERVLKSIDKKAFLDVLMGTNAKSVVVDNPPKNEHAVKEQADEDATWHVLRDDFMMSAKLKDWDKTVDVGGKSRGTGVENV